MSVGVSNRGLDDWPQWRGPRRDGVSDERGLLKDWPSGGPPLAWKASGAGEGYSSFATSGGRLYTLGARGGTEYVIAYDAATGKRLWETAHGQRFSNDRGDGPRATPTIEGDRLYAFGASGDLSAMDAVTGKVLWQVNVLKQFGGSNITWGLSESPLVLSDRILVNAGAPGASIVALRKTDGSLIWKSQRDVAGYSSAILQQVGAVRQAVYFTGQRALGINVDNGQLLWSYDRVSNNTANIATPIARGNRVFLSSAYGTGAALLEMTAGNGGVSAREVYFTREMRNHHASSVLVGDYLYGYRTPSSLRCSSIPARSRGVIAASARARSSTPTSGSISSARAASSDWQRRRRPATASTADSRSGPAACPRGATPSSRADSCS